MHCTSSRTYAIARRDECLGRLGCRFMRWGFRGYSVTELISLIIATYNRADAMDAVLRSLARQTDKNFEIVIADDGSGREIGDVLAAWTPRLPVRIKHVWHEDRGYRLPEIRNKAMRASAGHYIIWLDGDCVARPDF